jgi:hypothetical protein
MFPCQVPKHEGVWEMQIKFHVLITHAHPKMLPCQVAKHERVWEMQIKFHVLIPYAPVVMGQSRVYPYVTSYER